MRNIKKLLIAFLLVILIGGLTGCSQMNKVTGYFEEQGFVRYKYLNKGGSVLFRLHDALAEEETASAQGTTTTTTTDVTTTEAGTTEADSTDTNVTTTQEYNLRFYSYAFSNDTYAVVVMEFESEEYLLDLLENSPVLLEAYDGLDLDEYRFQNLLLVVIEDYEDEAQYFIDIFQGRMQGVEPTTVATTTEVTTTEAPTTTAAE